MSGSKAEDRADDRAERITIRDIAERAGVSKGAVSYALNGRPGVSDDTRDRILSIAQRARLVSEPRGARALGRARRRVRPRARTAGADARARAVLHGVPRRRRVGALGALDRAHDPARRGRRAGDRGLPALVGRASRRRRADGRPARRRPARRGARAARAAGRRGRRSGRKPRSTSGLARRSVRDRRGGAVPRGARAQAHRPRHRRRRVRPHRAADAPRSRAPRASSGSTARSSQTDYSAEQGARATRKLLSSPEPPTAIVFDSDLLAVTGLGVAQQMGFAVPDDLSIVGWDDSLISQVVHPPLTAITRDIEAFGIAAARHLLAAIEGARDRGRRDGPRRAHAPRQHRPPARLLALIARRRRRSCGKFRLTLNRISDGLRQRQ